MEILSAILHKLGEGIDTILDKIGRASTDSSIVVAPDYALAVKPERPVTNQEYAQICRVLENISLIEKTLIIPGTLPFAQDGAMVHQCPVFYKGNLVAVLNKETDRGEEELAKRHGLSYERGDCNKNNLPYNGKNIAVEIYSDHGHQEIPANTFLELILACDQNAGFWIGPRTPKFARAVIVCDSFKPKVEGFKLDQEGKPEVLKPILGDEERRVYEVQ